MNLLMQRLIVSDRNGNQSSAYQFNGTDSYIETTIERSSYSEFSVCTLYQYHGTIDYGYRSLFGTDGTDFAVAKDQFNSNIGIQDSNYISNFSINTNAWDGNWHHLCYINASGAAKLYLDNNLVGESNIGQGNGNIWIGKENQSNVFSLDGNMDEVRIYNKALNENEISVLFNQ